MNAKRRIRRVIFASDFFLLGLETFNPRANKGGGAGEWMQPPYEDFLQFSLTNYYLDLPFSVGVGISLAKIW